MDDDPILQTTIALAMAMTRIVWMRNMERGQGSRPDLPGEASRYCGHCGNFKQGVSLYCRACNKEYF